MSNDGMEVDVALAGSKKRLLSGSPEGKHWEQSGGNDGDDDGEEEEKDDEDEELDKSIKSKEDWKLEMRGKKSRLPSKREKKQMRRMERARLNKIEAARLAEESLAAKKTKLDVPAKTQSQSLSGSRPEPEKSKDYQSKDLQVPITVPTKKAQDVPPTEARPLSSIIAPKSYANVSVSANASVSASQSTAIPPVFRTPNADGPFKDEIVVEILSLDDKEFTGTITTSEARITIFEDVLGFKQDDLAGIKIGYN